MAIDKRAVINKNVHMGRGVKIHPFVVIESGVRIGDNVEILPFTYLGKIPGWHTLSRKKDYKKKIVIGNGCKIGPCATIYYDVEIGKQNLICEGASIREGCSIGSRCVIGRNVSLNYSVRIGNNTRILDGSHITGNTCIGNKVFISVMVSSTNDGNFNRVAYSNKMKGQHIGDNVMIGAGANILPGVKIGRNSIIAAGSVVKKDVSAGKLVNGNPAKTVGDTQKILNISKKSSVPFQKHRIPYIYIFNFVINLAIIKKYFFNIYYINIDLILMLLI